MATNSNDDVTNGRQFKNSEENQAESNIIPKSSKSIVKSRGRKPGKKKLTIVEKKQKDAERKKKSR